MAKTDLLTGLCDDDCPVRRCARIIEGKWTTLILRDLMSGPKRYSELMRSLGGISPKMLAQRLAFLEAQEIVAKTIYPVVPPHTEYALTARGRGLEAVIVAMAEFGANLAQN